MYKRIIRVAASIAMLYGVYTETGIWTTMLLACIVLNGELVAFYLQQTVHVLSQAKDEINRNV